MSSLPSSKNRDPLQPNSGARHEELKTDISIEDARTLAKPPGADDKFSMSASTLEGPGANGVLQPARGLNTKRLFSESLRDTDERFERLEGAVQDIRDEFDTMSPSINRLMAIEKDIQELVAQLETLLHKEDSAPEDISAEQLVDDNAAINRALGAPAPAAVDGQTPASATTATTAPQPLYRQTEPPAPPQTPSAPARVSARIQNIRIADHVGKTRIVIESPQKLNITADIDNTENILTLTMTGSASGFNMANIPLTSRLVRSANENPQGPQSFILAFGLSAPSAILDQKYLPPGAANAAYRYYIDLKR